jgi:hypothetical protein
VRYRPPEGATLAELDAGALDPIVTLVGSTGWPGPGSLGCGTGAMVGSAGWPGRGLLGWGWVGWGVSMRPLVPLGAAAIRLLLADVDVDHHVRIALQFQLVVDDRNPRRQRVEGEGRRPGPTIDRSSSVTTPEVIRRPDFLALESGRRSSELDGSPSSSVQFGPSVPAAHHCRLSYAWWLGSRLAAVTQGFPNRQLQRPPPCERVARQDPCGD